MLFYVPQASSSPSSPLLISPYLTNHHRCYLNNRLIPYSLYLPVCYSFMHFQATSSPSSPPQNPSSEPLYYVSYVPMSQVDTGSVSTERYATLVLAQKNAQKKMGFRKRLLDTCQNEFQSAGKIPSQLRNTRQYDTTQYNTIQYNQYFLLIDQHILLILVRPLSPPPPPLLLL